MITLYAADSRQNNRNCVYPHRIEVTDEASLKQAVSRDYVCAEFIGNKRSINNFIRCDCLASDVDNDHSDIPAEWVFSKDITYVEVDGVHMTSGWSYDRQNGNFH